MTHIKTLLKLKEQGELSYSQLPKALLKQLSDESLVDIKILSATRKKVIAKEQFYEIYKDIEKLDASTTRADLSKLATHTKSKHISPQEGLYLSGRCMIENVQLPLFKNSSLFLKEFPKLLASTLVVVVENFENLIYFESTLNYFKGDDIIFIFRNSAALKFIQTIKNEIIYFGDFDLAGIEIYQNQIVPRNLNIKLFIPDDIENLMINHGNSKLYKDQYNKYKNLKSKDTKIQTLINTINKYQKTLEQEWFI